MGITVAGNPITFAREVGREPVTILCPSGKEVNIRNVGMNTLWVSFDVGRTEFDVASGTSFDARLVFEEFRVRTKLGKTKVVGLVTS